jgi:formamidopyrimidine-DNA glycosylase
VGKEITGVEVREPVVIRVTIPHSFDEVLPGKEILEVYRKGPFLGFRITDGMELIVHPMLAGKFKWVNSKGKSKGKFCFRMDLEKDEHLFYLDEKRMGKVYLTREGDYSQIPRFREQGVDILSSEFTRDIFQSIISRRRDQVRVFLMDQTALSAIGNAYSDEILFHTHIHPKIFATN